RALAAAALLALPAAVLALCGDYTRLGNAARLIEEAVYSRLGGGAKDFCYLLTTFTWAGMGVLSSFAGELVKSALSPGRKAAFLAAGGAASLGVGLVLSAWIPPIRYIYTLSFVFETLGLSALLFAGLYALYDLLAFRRGTWLLILFGQCSLAAWMLVNFFGKALEAAGECLVAGVPNLLGADAARPLFVQVAKAAVLVWLIWQWRRLRGRRPSAAAAEQLSNGQGERE
ncbi:MAG: hypothetical protein IJ829_08260, partial [Kiritimatiellae bacterium]|nr:hypothetical protein [Kiritimatiellia bacterium]